MLKRAVIFLISSGLVACGGSQAGGVQPSSDCVSNVCAAATDCAMGTRCNKALQPPRCETLYCGAETTVCDDDLLCAQGLFCDLQQCSAGLGQGESCDQHACRAPLVCVIAPGSCMTATCQASAPAPQPAGAACGADLECASMRCDKSAGCPGTCAPPAKPYPAGPYGYNAGSTIANLAFKGKRDPSGSASYASLPLVDITLADYHNDASVKYLVLVAAAGWCTACKQQQSQLITWQSMYAAKGARFLEVLTQDSQGSSATEGTLNTWAQTYGLHLDLALDASMQLASIADPSTLPFDVIVESATMKILSIDVGVVDLGAKLAGLP